MAQAEVGLVAGLEDAAVGSQAAELSVKTGPELTNAELEVFQTSVIAPLSRRCSTRGSAFFESIAENAASATSPSSPSEAPLRVGPQDFEMLSVIGSGAYGKVIQVRYKPSNKLYAMKIMSKKLLQKKNHIHYIEAEREIMTKVDHPFLVSLKFAFQTDRSVYLVMNYLPGGELFHLLGKEGIFLEDSARFYLAEIILAVRALHNLGIIHRDLKPENVLLDAEGHICITDFGLAKLVEEAGDSSARTICGTNEYIAPEMFSGKGYNEAVDWWAVGCLFYEMLTGNPPFRAKSFKKLKEKVLNEKPKLPKYVSSEGHSLLKGLLERNVDKRLGSGKSTMFKIKGVQSILDHSFFKKINWNLLEQRKVAPPMVPKLQSEADTGNFAEEFTAMPVHSPHGALPPSSPAAADLFKRFSFVAPDIEEPGRELTGEKEEEPRESDEDDAEAEAVEEVLDSVQESPEPPRDTAQALLSALLEDASISSPRAEGKKETTSPSPSRTKSKTEGKSPILSPGKDRGDQGLSVSSAAPTSPARRVISSVFAEKTEPGKVSLSTTAARVTNGAQSLSHKEQENEGKKGILPLPSARPTALPHVAAGRGLNPLARAWAPNPQAAPWVPSTSLS